MNKKNWSRISKWLSSVEVLVTLCSHGTHIQRVRDKKRTALNRTAIQVCFVYLVTTNQELLYDLSAKFRLPATGGSGLVFDA